MKKRGLIFLLIAVLMMGLAACGEEKNKPEEKEPEPERTYSAILIMDCGALGDKSFNDSAWVGFEKATEELGVETKALECVKEEDYEPSIRAAANEQPDLIVALGYLMTDAVKTVAEEFPDQKFVLIDDVVDAPNVLSVQFKDQEGAFLVGVAAGMTTQTKTVGFVGGTQSAEIEKFQYGFQAGVKAVDPNIRVYVDYTGTFDDPVRGKELALQQHRNGADVVFHASGGCGIGVIAAAGEQGFWAIGVDMDQSELNPEAVLCSMIKRVDTVAFESIRSVTEDEFKGGSVTYGLKEEAVGYSDNAGNLPPEVREKMEQFSKKILDGSVKVPYDIDGFDTFSISAE